ncbi:MAG: hypothetical protein KGJ46_12735, partial [Xanthomonadaceae bacterium]|nr:hypothetical protein [Xanthomonadaceae bacterium]
MGVSRGGWWAIAVAVLALLCGVQGAAARHTTPPAASDASAPPVARTVNVVDHVFGLTLADPYRWMEGANNAEFDAWLKAQGEYTRAKLDALPMVTTWRERLQKADGGTVVNRGFQRAGGKVFFTRLTETGRALMVREADGRQRVLFDPASLKGYKGQAIQSFAPSPDGRSVAVDIGLGAGMEVSRMKILNIETMRWLPDTIAPVWSEFTAHW